MNEEEFIAKARAFWKVVDSTYNAYKPKAKETKPDEPAPQNIVMTLTPEAMLTILICVGAADNEAVQQANVSAAWRTKIKPASTISLFHTLRQQAREAGVIK